MVIFQRNAEIVKYLPSDSRVQLPSSGSFVEIEFQLSLSKQLQISSNLRFFGFQVHKYNGQ